MEKRVERLPGPTTEQGRLGADVAVGVDPGRDDEVGLPCLDHLEAARDRLDGRGEVGVGERDRGPAGDRHTGGDCPTLAVVRTQSDDPSPELVIPDRLLGQIGGAVVAAVVDEHQLGVASGQLGRRQGADRALDPRRLLVHRDDERAGDRLGVRGGP